MAQLKSFLNANKNGNELLLKKSKSVPTNINDDDIIIKLNHKKKQSKFNNKSKFNNNNNNNNISLSMDNISDENNKNLLQINSNENSNNDHDHTWSSTINEECKLFFVDDNIYDTEYHEIDEKLEQTYNALCDNSNDIDDTITKADQLLDMLQELNSKTKSKFDAVIKQNNNSFLEPTSTAVNIDINDKYSIIDFDPNNINLMPLDHVKSKSAFI